MVSYLNGKGIVSYNYLKEGFDKKNEDAIRKKIKADGFDGAITMRLIDVEKDEQYVRGNRSNFPIYYQNFSGYYHNMWSFYQTPGYFTTTKIYTIESNVYSIKDDKIIWSGLTETTNPDGVKKMTAEVAQAVYKQMIKEGFINKS